MIAVALVCESPLNFILSTTIHGLLLYTSYLFKFEYSFLFFQYMGSFPVVGPDQATRAELVRKQLQQMRVSTAMRIFWLGLRTNSSFSSHSPHRYMRFCSHFHILISSLLVNCKYCATFEFSVAFASPTEVTGRVRCTTALVLTTSCLIEYSYISLSSNPQPTVTVCRGPHEQIVRLQHSSNQK